MNTVAYISAGGRGSRLNEVFTPLGDKGIPKALLMVGEPPTMLIDHHIANVRSQDIDKVIVATGDQDEAYEYVQDEYGSDRNIIITKSDTQLGTGGDLIQAARSLSALEHKKTTVLIQNVDTVLDIDLKDFQQHYLSARNLGGVACIAVTRLSDVPNEGAYKIGEDGRVVLSEEFGAPQDTTELTYAYAASSTGAVAISPEFLRRQTWTPEDGQLSLYRDTLYEAWRYDKLWGYDNASKFFRDIGTAATWFASQNDATLQAQLRYDEHKIH